MKKFTLFVQMSATEIELAADRILCNDIRLPGEHHPYDLRLWCIGNEYGALGAVWATCDQDALDELVDSGLGDALLIDETDYANMSPEEQDECAGLGNAGEPCDLTNVWLSTVYLDKARDFDLIVALAEARGGCWKTLEQ